jgi:hypothetical protein
VTDFQSYRESLDTAFALLEERCKLVQATEDNSRSLAELRRVRDDLVSKWKAKPLKWADFPPSPDGEYLMLWPGQFATFAQKQKGVTVPSSMRQVDSSSELEITQAYSSGITSGGGSDAG